MTGPSPPDRARLSEAILANRGRVAEAVTEDLLRRHPDGLARSGEEARRPGIEDASVHLTVLVGSVESGSVTVFEDYGRWMTRVQDARGVAPGFLAGTLLRIGEALGAGHSIVDVYIDVFQEAQYRVGKLWEANRITVAQEHRATVITQFVLGQVYSALAADEPHRGNLVIAGVEGDLHQVGSNMVADVLEARGLDVRFLGTDMPHEGILRAVEEHEASVLGISATMLFNLPRVRSLVELAWERFGSRIRIVVGGSAFRTAPTLYRSFGADGCAPDLRATLELLCSDAAA